MKKQFFHLWLLFFMGFLLMSYSEEKRLHIIIRPQFSSERVAENTWYVTQNNDSIQFSKLRFYLTNFEIEKKDGTRYSIPDSNFLVDVFSEETLQLKFPDVSYAKGDELLFNIGVEKEMNTAGALAGALDPSNGMYWSWQSGYINFKLEGKSPSCASRKNKFQFHIGGYTAPYETTKRVHFILNAPNEPITLPLQIDAFFKNIQLKDEYQIMIPGEKASVIAATLPKLFSVNE